MGFVRGGVRCDTLVPASRSTDDEQQLLTARISLAYRRQPKQSSLKWSSRFSDKTLRIKQRKQTFVG